VGVIQEYGHQVTVDGIDHHATSGDKMDLIPVATFDVDFELLRIADRRQERRLFVIGLPAEFLSAKRAVRARWDAAARSGTAFDERSRVHVLKI